MNEGSEMAKMLPKAMEVLNVEFWKSDGEQIYDVGWVAKTETDNLKELSKKDDI